MPQAQLASAVSNGTRIFSPVTLSQEWPSFARLLLVVGLAVAGTIINGFFVASFFVEQTLRRIGNVFLACVGLADLMVTSAVMPISAVVLLSGQWDDLPVCRILQFITESSTYCYSIFFALVGIESYYKFCCSTDEYTQFMTMKISILSIFVFVIGFVLAGLGVYMGLDYDYCQRINYGNFYFRMATMILFHIMPFLATVYTLMCASFRIHFRAQEQTHYRRSLQYKTDYSSTNINITAFSLYFISWIPYLIILFEFPDTSDNNFYHCVWIGICRSIVTSLLYCTFNATFRHAFAHLFYYCCCKTTLAGPVVGRHRRAMNCRYRAGDVRVHIMHQVVNTSSPQRNVLVPREPQAV